MAFRYGAAVGVVRVKPEFTVSWWAVMISAISLVAATFDVGVVHTRRICPGGRELQL